MSACNAHPQDALLLAAPQGADKEEPFFDIPEGWEHTCFQLDMLPVERLFNPSTDSTRVVLQLHGGGYLCPLTDDFRRLALQQAQFVEARETWMVDYRLASSHPYPAALEDAAKAYDEILRRGTAPEDILAAGDSAGGNLALALCLRLRDEGKPQPGMLYLLSPWTTMETDSPSRRRNAEKDRLHGGIPFLHDIVTQPSPYAGNLDLKDPRISPLYADLSGLPPMLVQAGGYELLLDDALKLAEKATQDGVEITLSVYPGMPHDFALILPEKLESAAAFTELRDFVLRHGR